jgi:carboxylesterase
MKMDNQSDLVAVRFPFRQRRLSSEELLLTKPFFIPGSTQYGVLLIHGFTGTPAIWRDLASKLSKLGVSLSCPLLPGHGHQSSDLLTVHWEDWYQCVENAYLELNKRCSHVIVIGHSLGGALALMLASKHPSIQKLFLIAPAVYPTLLFRFFIESGLASFLKMLGISYLPPISGNLKKRDAWEFSYPRTAINALLEIYACMQATQRILPQVKNATMIFQSRHDLLVPSNRTLEIVEQLSSGQKEVIWLDNSYHVILLDNDADNLTGKIIASFIL